MVGLPSFLFSSMIFLNVYITFIYVIIYLGGTHVEEDSHLLCGSQFSPSTIWDLGIEVKVWYLTASTFTHWAAWPGPNHIHSCFPQYEAILWKTYRLITIASPGALTFVALWVEHLYLANDVWFRCELFLLKDSWVDGLFPTRESSQWEVIWGQGVLIVCTPCSKPWVWSPARHKRHGSTRLHETLSQNIRGLERWLSS